MRNGCENRWVKVKACMCGSFKGGDFITGLDFMCWVMFGAREQVFKAIIVGGASNKVRGETPCMYK